MFRLGQDANCSSRILAGLSVVVLLLMLASILALGIKPVAAMIENTGAKPLLTLPGANSLGDVRIPVYGLQLELDTRPDMDGLQTSMTAVKDFPSGVHTLVGQPGLMVQPDLPQGAVVKADISGPAYGDKFHTIEGPPNGLMELPNIQVPGDYSLRNVRLEDVHGNIILRRPAHKDRIRIKVIKKLLVNQVTSRALTLDEIKEKGIVIDEKNFTAVNFTVGLTLGSEKVEIDMPIAIPTAQAELTKLRPPNLTRLPSVQRAFESINIPNFSLSGFQMKVPPDLQDSKGIELPPINGVIVIPGNIGFLNQFFSVILQATNVAPEGSELVLKASRANILLPKGKDGIKGSGDDPLQVAATKAHGIQEILPLLDTGGGDSIVPQATNQAEFLVEGLSEGTHRVDFNITGDLYIPQLGKTLPMVGEAGGLVQVRNPTFNITLAHPDVVREGEAYSIFATVTNTSSNPANLFQLGLSTRSMSGARVADGEEDLKKLESLGPGQAESFEFKLVAMTTGEVSGTVFLADEGINGSFILTTGVGDTGIPLSPDTLVLPKEARNLPKKPDLLFQAIRLLGQAYSVATAPAGTLPPEIPRMRKSFVFDQAVGLAQAGLRTRFGQSALGAARDIAMDYLGGDINRLEELYPDDEELREQRRADLVSFDTLRRLADAGHDFSDVMGEMLAAQMIDPGQVQKLQADWAEVFASRPAHLSFGVSSQGPPLELRVTDAGGRALGRLSGTDPVRRELPYAGRLPLFVEDEQSATMLLLTAPGSDTYTMEFSTGASQALRASLILPADGGMEQVVFPEVVMDSGGQGRILWKHDGTTKLQLELDKDGDGQADQVLQPEVRTAIRDRGPRLLGVRQWAKGAQPSIQPSFEQGDPLGRMVGVLYDETVERVTATDPALYQVEENEVTQIAMQPDGRLLFMVFERPVGPFVQRELRVSGVSDAKGNRLQKGVRTIAPDPERGTGGSFRGQVVHADGRPVSFATVKYIQPMEKKALLTGGCLDSSEVRDAVITTYETDQEGRFSIDYVLQADFPPDCPDNADIWLNEHSPPGTQNFKLEATDPETGEIGKASTRIHFDGQSMGLKVVIRGYGTIKGQAVEEDGTPIAGGNPGTSDALWVRARNISTGEWFSTWVDAEGNYFFPREFTSADGKLTEVPRMPTGNVVLQLVRAGDGYTAVTTANLPGGGSTVNQDLLMIPPSRYSKVDGRVMEADGVTGAANVLVQVAGEVLTSMDLYSRSYASSVVGSTHTDKDGNFSFDSVPTGPIDIRAFRQATYEQARVESQLEEGEEESVVLIFPGTGGTVRGLVRDAIGKPVPGATVAGGPTLTDADENGFFEIKGLPLGSYTIYAQSKDSPALGQVKVQTLGPEDVQQVVVTLQPLGSVTGTVYEADGTTRVGSQRVQLWAEPDKGALAETMSDAEGSFRFDDYPLGKYSVRAVRKDHGDGGMTYTSLRYAGDTRDADIFFRGMGDIQGRVIQSNGTPVLSDVIVTSKVWRIISSSEGEKGNLYMEFVRAVQSQVNEDTAKQIEDALQSAGLSEPPADFFMLVDESRLISSDIKGTGGEVTGKFRLGNVLAGPFKVAAFGPFLAPAEKRQEIPRTRDAKRRHIDVGDVVLEPATGEVRGIVYMPDGKTPVGEGVTVRIRSLDSSGSIMTAGGGVTQPVLPEYSVTTDGKGKFHFPLVLRGRFNLVADTGTPERGLKIKSAKDIQTRKFADKDGKRLLNVRIYGSANGVVPAGETLETRIRLLNATGVSLEVVENDGKTPVELAKVSLHTESTLDADEEASMAKVYTDKNGLVELFPVIEGRFSIHASKPFSPARGRIQGVVEQNVEPGKSLQTRLTLGAVTTAAGKVINAKIFGTVEGRVLKADGSAQTNPVQVTVRAAGANLLATTDDNGRFSLIDVPGGNLKIEAFEPFTARRATATSKIVRQDEKVAVTMKLIGLGTVAGSVLSSDGKLKMSGLDVILYPQSRFSDRLISRSDTQGMYELPGVPVGHYRVRVKDYENGLTGEAEGDVRQDNERRTTDVLLEPTGQISGTVYAAGVQLDETGKPLDAGQPAVHATVLLKGKKSTQTLQADEQGRFQSTPFLPLGDYRITVTSKGGDDGVLSNTKLQFNGERRDTALAMSGHGVLKGVVLDSSGKNPVKSARVSLRSRSPFSRGELARFTPKDGTFLFEKVPLGQFEIQVKTTISETELGSTVQGTLDKHGQVISFTDSKSEDTRAIRLQAAGGIRGRVFHDDGKTPAAAAVVELKGRQFTLGRETDAEGRFEFDALPLGDYGVSVQHAVSNGQASRWPRLEENAQLIAYDDITLDSRAPEVVSTQPTPNATSVAGSQLIHIKFSEVMDAGSINPQTFLVRVDGKPVAGRLELNKDQQEVIFTPSRPIPDLQQVHVLIKGDSIGFEGQVIARGVRDRAGVGMREDLQFVYTTWDATPPQLVQSTPEADARGISLDQVVRLEFSEPMQPKPLETFRLLQNGKAVEGRLDIPQKYAGRVLVFTPRRRLAPNARFRVETSGPLKDLAGNILLEGKVAYGFDTLDTRPPKIRSVSLEPGMEPIEGKQVQVTAELEAASDVDIVEFYIDKQLVGSAVRAPWSTTVYLDPALGREVIIEAVARDKSGNNSQRKKLPLQVASNTPPVVRIVSPGNTQVSAGQVVVMQVATNDDVGLQQIAFTANGGGLAGGTQAVGMVAQAQASFSFKIPADHPIGSKIELQALTTDTQGLVAASKPVRLSVLGKLPPDVFIDSPENAIAVDPGAEVSVEVRADDATGITELGLSGSGLFAFSEIREIEPVSEKPTQTFVIQIPQDAAATGKLTLSARALDSRGNAGNRSITLRINDRIQPEVKLAAHWGDNSRMEPGSKRDLRIDLADEIGVEHYEILLKGQTIFTSDIKPATQSTLYPRITLPTDIELGTELKLVARARDTSGNTGDSEPLIMTAADLTPPVVKVESGIPAKQTVKAGEKLQYKLTASDSHGVKKLVYSMSGFIKDKGEFELGGTPGSVEKSLEFQIPEQARVGGNIGIALTATDPSGNSRTAHHSVRVFDEVRPKLKEVFPLPGEKNALPDKSLKFVFSEAIDRKSLSADTLRVTGPAGAVDGSYSFGSYRPDVVYFNPKESFDRGVTYGLHLTDKISDRTGNKLEQEHKSRFTVDNTSPILVEQYPVKDAQGVPSRPVIRFVFDEPVQRETVKSGAVRLLNAVGGEVTTELRFKDKDKTIELHPKNVLKLGASYQLELSGAIADRAGNPIILADGSSFKSRTTAFTTGSIRFISPLEGASVRENSRIRIAISGEGLAASDVIYEVNGKTMTPVTGPDFAMAYQVPPLGQSELLSVLAIVRDQEQKEIARKHMTASISAGLHGFPPVLGIVRGEDASLRLSLRQALDTPLDISLSLGDESVARVPNSSIRIPPGKTVADIRVMGLKTGQTWIAAESDYGKLHTAVSVSEIQPGEDRLVASSTVALSIMPPARQAKPESVVHAGIGVSRRMPEVLRAVTIPHTGEHNLQLPIPGPLPSRDLRLGSSSADMEVVSVEESVALASGSRMLPLKINALSVGQTYVGVTGEDRHYRIPLHIGPGKEKRHTGIQSLSTGVAVNPSAYARHLHLSQLGKRSLDIPLLANPAATKIKVELESSVPSVVEVGASSYIAAGSRHARIELTGVAPGSGVVSARVGNVITPLYISVVDTRADFIDGVVSSVPGISVAPGGSAGTLYMPPGSRQTWVLRTLGIGRKSSHNGSIKSRHPEYVTAASSEARIEAGSQDLVLALSSSKEAKGEALLDLQLADRTETLRVVIINAEQAGEPLLLSPAVGIEIKQ